MFNELASLALGQKKTGWMELTLASFVFCPESCTIQMCESYTKKKKRIKLQILQWKSSLRHMLWEFPLKDIIKIYVYYINHWIVPRKYFSESFAENVANLSIFSLCK